MNKEKRNNIIDGSAFAGYFVVGILTRYLLIPFCNPFLGNLTISMGYVVIPFIIMFGVCWGFVSFFFPNVKRSRFGQGMVAGFGTGFGVMTVYALALNPCI